MNYEVTSGIQNLASKVVIYGVEGVGKSTLASKFPDPLFIDTEGSTSRMDVKRFPKPTSWSMLQDEVKDVMIRKLCKTLVIDTADWAERLCTESVCQKHGKSGVEDFGYGNGYTYIAEEWGRFLNLLQDVVDSGIHVVLNCHAIIRKFEQPNEMGAYDRYELKLGKKTTGQTAPITKEWADMILFLNYKTYSVATDDKGKKYKAQGNERVMYTTHHPCWDAKNRSGLPEECPIDYEVIRHVIEGTNLVPAPETDLQPTFSVDSGVQTTPITEEQASEDPYHHNEFVSPNVAEPINELDPRIPKKLRDLMMANSVTEQDVQGAVSAKGYMPVGMAVADYPPDFIEGVLVAAWPQVYSMILDQKKIPF